MKFTELELHPDLFKGIQDQNFTDLTPVQTDTIPLVLETKDVAVLSQTGTGKTAAYAIPLIERMLRSMEDPAHPRAIKEWRSSLHVLVLVPTRELAEQVVENIRALIKHTPLKAVAVYGGTGYDVQKKAFADGVNFICATPGRLIDLYKEQVFDLHQTCAVVFDEADRMFDMGFKDDMKYLLHRIPRTRQFLVLSATLNFDVLNTAYQFGSEPVEINVGKDKATAENVEHEIFHVGQEDKAKYLLSLIKRYNPTQAIVFSNFKNNVERVAQFLSANGVPAMGISSLLSQQQRTRVMESFKEKNEITVLVATDVAARGLDIKGVDLVVNFELSEDPENYVHRIGRTGRAGAKGKAFSLVSDRDVDSLSRIEEFLKIKIAMGWLDDADIITDFKPFPAGTWRDDMKKHRDQRGNDRGPRQGGGDRGPRSGGPRHGGGDRGPRSGGPRHGGGDRGPRREGRPGGDRGPRHGGDRGPRRDGPRQDGPRQDGPRQENRPRHEGRPPRNDNRDQRNGEQRQGQNRDQRHGGNQGQNPNRRPQGPQQNPQGGKSKLVRQGGQGGKPSNYQGGRYRVDPKGGVKPSAQQSLGSKVTSLIKNLFGSKPK